jgi:tRNA (guanine-N7-)-methyltransferase
MDIRPEYRKKSIRSYVVRAGRMTDGQRKAYEKSWATYGLKLADGAIDTDVIFGRTGPKVLEIGFGMGDSLLQMAAAEPETDFIGIEVHPPGVGTIMNTAQEENISNLRVYLADANDVLEECFAAQSINRLQLYFPSVSA